MIEDLIKYVITNLRQRFTRSFLTILSILIGIMAIFILMSFGQGLVNYMNQMSEDMGADKIMVMPIDMAFSGNIYLTQDDLDFIKKQRGVAEATAMMMKQTEVKIDKDKLGKWVFIAGMPTDSSEQRLVEEAFAGYGIIKGRNLKEGDSKKAVLGYNYMIPDKIFSKTLKIGDKIYIQDEHFEVIGFYEEVGTPQDDSNVYLTNEVVGDLFDMEGEYGYIFVKAEKNEDPSELAEKLQEKLRRHKGQEEGQEDFYVQSFDDLMETMGTVLLILNSILVIIAGISVLVAAVNIMNTMYTAVLERTKEIGIMKAIGAKNSTILFIFFFESGMLGLIGGGIGIIIGFALAKLGETIIAASGYSFLKPSFPWWLTVGCLFFSFAVGAASGYFPAKAASRLKPVDALRYE
ncbi:MAG: ABC transporter permease [Candidatus Nanoarchaeia archaeon]|nr:ABC transporter permease [Candidatus Nanoarchaeia archaeon]